MRIDFRDQEVHVQVMNTIAAVCYCGVKIGRHQGPQILIYLCPTSPTISKLALGPSQVANPR
jgi:hypothetical protein